MVNGYVDTLDTIYREEVQHSTINVGINKGEVNGELNTDADKMSTVTEDKKVAGKNISFTLAPVMPSKKKTDSADLPSVTPSKPTTPTQPANTWPTVIPSKPIITSPGGSSALGGFTGAGSVKPVANAPGGGTRSDVTQAGKPSRLSSSTPAAPVQSVKSSSGNSSKSDVAVKATGIDTHKTEINTTALGTTPGVAGIFKASPASNTHSPTAAWPAVQPNTSIVTSMGSSSIPGLFSGKGSAKSTADAGKKMETVSDTAKNQK